MNCVITGGTGQIGTLLTRAFLAAGHAVVLIGRNPRSSACKRVRWDPMRADGPREWTRELEGADVVVNLAGKSVNCRYTPENRREILKSRVLSTRAIGRAIAACRRPPRVWLQASTATIYAHRFDAPNDEATGIIGGAEPDVPPAWHFSIKVATAWERELEAAVTPHTRKVALRSAVTLSPDRGGIFDTLLGLVRRGFGGWQGDGKQYVSWIHDVDFVRALSWLIERDHLHGAINLASPNPLPNAQFMRHLRWAWGMPFGLPATRTMLTLGAMFLGTETELVLKSRRVVPVRLERSGFRFEYPEWPAAAEELCRRWRAGRRAA